jgi:hypothetical protein
VIVVARPAAGVSGGCGLIQPRSSDTSLLSVLMVRIPDSPQLACAPARHRAAPIAQAPGDSCGGRRGAVQCLCAAAVAAAAAAAAAMVTVRPGSHTVLVASQSEEPNPKAFPLADAKLTGEFCFECVVQPCSVHFQIFSSAV